MSQLELASIAGSTSRYISFIETGRSIPRKNIILRLAKALNLTLRDSNSLLVSAGSPPAFAEQKLSDKEMQPIQRIVDQVLKKHDPFPAWALGPGLRLLASNETAEKVYPGMVGMEPKDLIDIWCTPSEYVSEEDRIYTIFQTINVLRHEMFHYPHPELPALLQQVEAYADGVEVAPELSDSPVMCPTIMVNGKKVPTLSTIMRFDKVVNITMAEIRIELIFPADDEGEAIFRAL